MPRWLDSSVMETACPQAVRLESEPLPNARQGRLQREGHQNLEGFLNVS